VFGFAHLDALQSAANAASPQVRQENGPSLDTRLSHTWRA